MHVISALPSFAYPSLASSYVALLQCALYAGMSGTPCDWAQAIIQCGHFTDLAVYFVGFLT